MSIERARAAYDLHPDREWERLIGGAQARLEYVITTHALGKHLPADRSLRILDAGGGPGRYTIDLAKQGYRMTLLDLSPNLLDLAREKIARMGSEVEARVEAIVEGSITDLSRFENGEFDAVLCLGGPLSHLIDHEDRGRAIAGLGRVANSTAPIFISVMNRLGAYRSAVQWPDWFPGAIPRLVDGSVGMIGRGGAPTWFFMPEEFCEDLADGGLAVDHLYGCNGIGAHLDEDNLLDLMADDERWPAWRDVLLKTCDHPNVLGVSNHILAVAHSMHVPCWPRSPLSSGIMPSTATKESAIDKQPIHIGDLPQSAVADDRHVFTATQRVAHGPS